ncbi:tryptophan--tRNA ligase [Buchnera aphidicola]|uniref:Tryptophan--tRNA ligase n=1 Tax=Buchnera aphidicola (Therioaphis trifolii) TaxID=1241884 RepID=A0A4D6YBR5_9GAMM|nr:tryptophan--tRNA ligase [Buchnera aphidicola]QCI27346.1 tryptophan--tRNA ligase [Buchnera aphidicola (Therioaphis trifolii)]
MVLLKPIIFSAIQPSGQLTLGNFIGTISHWSTIQDKYNCIYSIADLHSITVSQNLYLFKKNKLDTLAIYLASGVDPQKSIIFMQSEVHEHCQLNWILNCYTYFGELMRMTQFKSKSKINSQNINIGLFNYPILMSADILLYQSDKVLIGQDQKQHIELTRNIAHRFNSLYGNIFKIPDIYIPNKYSAKIMSLLNPYNKMSKSDSNKNSVIFLLDDQKTVLKKISKSVTDSDGKIFYDINNKAGISNLLNIFSSLTGKSILELEKKFFNTTYKDFKYLLANVISKKLNDLQEKFYYFRSQKSYLKNILDIGAYKARKKAKKNIKVIYDILNL